MFVRESRKTLANTRREELIPDIREKDPSWVLNMLVSIHPSLRCWRANGKDSEDPNR